MTARPGEVLTGTARAFDSVAATYDEAAGNNPLIQRMREALWRAVEVAVPPRGRILDLGCGTGLDAAHFAGIGFRVVALDVSAEMVRHTRARAEGAGLAHRITAFELPVERLGEVPIGRFDAITSDLGPLNCVADLAPVAAACADRLAPGGVLVASVLGRFCPWEVAHYALRGHLRRAVVRLSRGMVGVGLNEQLVWTRYWTPRAFAGVFRPHFELRSLQALGLVTPPPYRLAFARRHPRLVERLAALEAHLGAWPLLRQAGDHFLITLRRRP